jgi:hypothetical protein
VTTPRSHPPFCLNAPFLRRASFYLLLAYALGAAAGLSAPAGTSPLDDKKPAKPYALIYGTVYGPDDHTVYGVKVKIRRANEKKARWELHSDHSGEFAQRVPTGPGDYVIWADLKGFKSPL